MSKLASLAMLINATFSFKQPHYHLYIKHTEHKLDLPAMGIATTVPIFTRATKETD